MKKQPKFKQLTMADYTLIVTVMTLNPDKNNATIAKLVGRSHPTVANIRRSTSWSDYKAITKGITAKNKAVKASKTPKPTTGPATLSVPTEDLAKMFTLLAEISEKLDRVAVPKRSLFR